MPEENPVTEAVRKVVEIAEGPATKMRYPLAVLMAAVQEEGATVTDEALLLLPQELRLAALCLLSVELMSAIVK